MSRSTRQNSGVPTSRRQMILRRSDRASSGPMRSDATAHTDRTALRAGREHVIWHNPAEVNVAAAVSRTGCN